MRGRGRRRTYVFAAALLAVLAVFVAAALASTSYGTLTGGAARINGAGVHTQSITTLNSGSGWWLQGFHYAGSDWYSSCAASCSTNAGSGYCIPASPVFCADGVGPYNVTCKYP